MTVQEIETSLIRGISSITNQPESSIAPDKPLHELGIDSLGFVEILVFVEAYLAGHPYFGGQMFSAADIIMLMIPKLAERLPGLDMADYPHLTAWKAKVEARPAFARMRAAALPDGVVPILDFKSPLLYGLKLEDAEAG